STVGKGSRFWFRIRVERAADRPSKTQMRRGPLSTISLDVPSAKALVVEDNATNRKVVKAFLEKLGVSVETATNGREALQIIQTGQQYDFVLMDCQMPVMDGLEATRRIRAWEHGAMDREPLPIIALTASAFESDKQKCLASGMSDYLAKPIDYVKLRERLGKWCPSLSS
ncbi:MAG: response regulator, partial [Candidatus Eisenbacteria bacterium]|nr:response regulator [Candidatus Eisenbacteria bacterium]